MKKIDVKPNNGDNVTMPTKKERSNYGKYLGSIRSEKKAAASRKNGALGGRPKIKKGLRKI